MKAVAIGLAVLVTLGGVGSSISAQDGTHQAVAPAPAHAAAAALGTYCSTCHNGSLRSPSGPVLDQLDAAQIASRPDVWARAYRQLQAGAMPPVGAPRPDRATTAAVLAAIEDALGAQAARPAGEATSSQATALRLASLLWNGEPDAELRREAGRNQLTEPAAIERQVRRMLADDRAGAFVSRFLFPWLQLDKLPESDPDLRYFPDYVPSLRDAMATETELFLLSQLRDDRDLVELWNAGYTFLNEQLARHYGVAGVSGPQFRRVPLAAPERAGLLGQGSVLMVTSRHQHGVDAAYTTPAKRSIWVRQHFLGAPLPNGFPGAQPVKPELPITPQARALAAEPCGNCHRNFFPIGYALENFDPLGRWRTHDQLGPVDSSGTFVDGTPTNSVVELRQALLQRPDAFRTTMVESLVAYSTTGTVPVAASSNQTPRNLTATTLVRARRILRQLPEPRWSAVLAAVVRE